MKQRIVITLGITIVALVAATAALAGTLTATATVSGTAGVSLNLPANPSITDTLTGDPVLPGFALPLADLFNDPQLNPRP